MLKYSLFSRVEGIYYTWKIQYNRDYFIFSQQEKLSILHFCHQGIFLYYTYTRVGGLEDL